MDYSVQDIDGRGMQVCVPFVMCNQLTPRPEVKATAQLKVRFWLEQDLLTDSDVKNGHCPG
jgi:hypothetical protein